MSWLSSCILRKLWHILMLSYLLYSAIVYYIFLVLKCIFVKMNQNNNPSSFVRQMKRLLKFPKHVALSFQYERTGHVICGYNKYTQYPPENEMYFDTPILDLAHIAKVIAWMVGAGIPIIDLYDYHGFLQVHNIILRAEVEEAFRHFSEEAFGKKNQIFPNIYWHQVLTDKGCTSTNNFEYRKLDHGRSTSEVHIFIYSYQDGKPKLLEMVKEVYVEKFKNKLSDDCNELREPLIDVNVVNEYLMKGCCSSLKTVQYKIEPDLLLNFGPAKSTLEFLPWHIRLTEMKWLPDVKHVQLSEVLKSFRSYEKCEQRFGK